MVLSRSLILASAVALTACANNTMLYNPPAQGMAFQDLNYMKWDCAHAAEQTAFLNQQLATTTPFPFDADRRAIIYKNLNEIRTYCPPQQPKPVGCVHVREDMQNGTGQATVCNSNPHGLGPVERPVVNRWDPLVDSK
jgi:hypothetical protein